MRPWPRPELCDTSVSAAGDQASGRKEEIRNRRQHRNAGDIVHTQHSAITRSGDERVQHVSVLDGISIRIIEFLPDQHYELDHRCQPDTAASVAGTSDNLAARR